MLKSLVKQSLPMIWKRYCPICENHARSFIPYGDPARDEVMCPSCHSLERHRLLWLFLRRKTDLFTGGPDRKMLHIAPERCFSARFQDSIGAGYLTADYHASGVMEQMDITDIHHPEATFDIIYCSHVLEHVPDDRAAIREFRRVLKPDGWAVLMVPITSEMIVEDPTIQDPELQKKLFGQEDHVRRYGLDFAQRVEQEGFRAAGFSAEDFLTKEEREAFRLAMNEWVFLCN